MSCQLLKGTFIDIGQEVAPNIAAQSLFVNTNPHLVLRVC
jgi:hypothetical protein